MWQTAAVAAPAAAMRGKDVNCLVGLFSGEGERRAIYFATGLHHCKEEEQRMEEASVGAVNLIERGRGSFFDQRSTDTGS